MHPFGQLTGLSLPDLPEPAAYLTVAIWWAQWLPHPCTRASGSRS